MYGQTMDKSFFCKRIDYFQGTMVRKQITLQMNFNRSITFLFMLLTLLGFEQDEQKVYSLWARYEKEISVEEKVYLLDDLNDLHIYTKPDSAKNIIEEMIAISKADTYKHGILRGEFLLGHYYSTIGLQDTTAIYFRRTLERTKADDDDTFLATALKNLSIYQSHLGNYQEAIRLMDSSATLQYERGDFMRFGSAQNAIGRIYFEMGNYPKAMEMYKAALRTMDTIDITSYHKADVLGNIGSRNNTQENYDEALEYYKIAMQVHKDTEDNLYQANTHIDTGNVHLARKSPQQAIDNYKKALEISIAYDFPTVKELAYANLGVIYKEEGDYSLAIGYPEDALALKETESSIINTATYLSELGHAHLLSQSPEKALYYVNRAIALADSSQTGNELQTSLKYRSLVYKETGRYEDALQDMQRSHIIKDSLFSIEKAKQINKLQTIYETEKKEAEIALQEEEINTWTEKAKVDTLTKSLYAGAFLLF